MIDQLPLVDPPNTCYLLQSVLDLRIMQKDCKKEAKDFDNAVHEMAYTIGQVRQMRTWPRFRSIMLM